jgi:arylsulfatase A-like enzyme
MRSLDMRRAWRDVVGALGIGLGAAVLVAMVIAWRAAIAERWWEGGYLRLIADCVWDRFDRIAPVAGGAALVVGAAVHLALRRRASGSGGRGLFRVGVAALVLVGLLRAATALDAWRAAKGPNVLLISIDTLRADHLGTYGNDLPTSPTIDRRLAGEGVTFDHVYSQSPKTTPSHMTMLTSLYPCVHGIEIWDPDHPAHVLNPAVTTLAEVLKNAGYATAAFTGGAHVHRSRGFDQGFDRYKHGQQLERTLDWIGQHRARKWFLFFHTYEIHDPYLPPADVIPLFDADYRGPILTAVERLRGHAAGWEQAHKVFWDSVDPKDPRAVRFVRHLYDAGIRAMDDTTIPRLLDALDNLGLAPNTLVVFTSDHGEAFGEHGRFMHDDVYEGTLHVPLILRFPVRLPAGRRVRRQAAVIDVMPTVLDLLGIAAPDGIEGRSLVPLLRDDEERGYAATSEYAPGGLVSVRREGLTYIAEGSTELLFDRSADGLEERNLVAARPELLREARADLARWRDECHALAARFGPTSASVAPDAETVKQLRALGYVQ